MLDPHFPSKSELMKMSISQIKSLRILYREEEELVQEVIRERQEKPAIKLDFYDNDIKGAHVATPEQEKELQEEYDKRRRQALEQMGLTEDELPAYKELQDKQITPAEKLGIKCELCGSRSYRHKKGCPTLLEIVVK